MRRGSQVVAMMLAGMVLTAGAAQALTDQQKCFLTERTAGGALAAAKLKCYAKAAKSGVAVDSACLAKADAKFDAKVAKANAAGPCGGEPDIIQLEYVYAFLSQVNGAVTGPPAACAAAKLAAVGKAVTSTLKCYASATKKDVGTPPDCLQAAKDKLSASLAKADAKGGACGGDVTTLQAAVDSFVVPTASFPLVDNGDGTISDPVSGLMWEKKSDDNSIHDVDNLYTWTSVNMGTTPDGTAFTEFLATLNTPPCFAGYCDWRLPNQNGLVTPFTGPRELETLRNCRYPDGSNIDYDAICIPPAFNSCSAGCSVTSGSCTYSSYPYWSSTSDPGDPTFAWFVSFSINDSFTNAQKYAGFPVRAVRP